MPERTYTETTILGATRSNQAHGPLIAVASRLESQLAAWSTLLERSDSDRTFLAAWKSVTSEIRALAGNGSISSLLDSQVGRRFDGRFARFQRRYLFLA